MVVTARLRACSGQRFTSNNPLVTRSETMSAKQKEEKVKRVNRNTAANRAVAELVGKTTLTELAEKANQIVVDSGGEDKVKETSWHVKRALATAEALGVVKLVRPTDIQIERLKK